MRSWAMRRLRPLVLKMQWMKLLAYVWAMLAPSLRDFPFYAYWVSTSWNPEGEPLLQTGFSTARTGSSSPARRRRAIQIRSIVPAKTLPALASCALDKPHRTLGLRRKNSTRKRAVPVRIRYSPRMVPAGRCLRPRIQSQSPIAKPPVSS